MRIGVVGENFESFLEINNCLPKLPPLQRNHSEIVEHQLIIGQELIHFEEHLLRLICSSQLHEGHAVNGM